MYKVECVDSIKGKKITDYKIIAIYNEKIVILKRNRMGVIDIDGNELIPAIYSEIIDCINDCFIVRFKNKYGLVNCNNEAVIDFKYNYLKHLQDSYFQGKFFDDYIIDIKTGNGSSVSSVNSMLSLSCSILRASILLWSVLLNLSTIPKNLRPLTSDEISKSI